MLVMKYRINLLDADQIKYMLKARYRLYVQRYISFAGLRGFKSKLFGIFLLKRIVN
jgi:hypothetical protein